MKIYLGADHGGFYLKQKVIDWLKKNNYQFEDEGNTELNPGDDYPQFAQKVVNQMLASNDEDPRGVLICKGAQGMGIAANRYKGIRASVVWEANEAKMTRNDNDSNVLCLPARLYEDQPDEAMHIIKVWLDTPFSDAPRHHRRVAELDKMGV